MQTAQQRAPLGPNQIKWLRANIPPFDEAWKAVQAADAHSERVKAKLQLKSEEDQQ